MDLEIPRALCREVIGKVGAAGLMEMLDRTCTAITGASPRFYQMSADWQYIDAVKIIKCKGADGDLIVHLT